MPLTFGQAAITDMPQPQHPRTPPSTKGVEGLLNKLVNHYMAFCKKVVEATVQKLTEQFAMDNRVVPQIDSTEHAVP